MWIVLLNMMWSMLTGFALGYTAYYYRRYKNEEYLVLLIYVQLFTIARVMGASYIELGVGMAACVLTLVFVTADHEEEERLRLKNINKSYLQNNKKVL